MGKEKDNQLFQWVKPPHLNDEFRNPIAWIAIHAWEFGVNVDRVLLEVHSESFSKDTRDSFEVSLNFQPLVDSTSVRQSSRPSTMGTFTIDYDGSWSRTDDECDNTGNVGGNVGQQ